MKNNINSNFNMSNYQSTSTHHIKVPELHRTKVEVIKIERGKEFYLWSYTCIGCKDSFFLFSKYLAPAVCQELFLVLGTCQ